jgi:uncharacterized membrane protein
MQQLFQEQMMIRSAWSIAALMMAAGFVHGQTAEFIPVPGTSSIPGSNENVCILSGSGGYSGSRVSADGQVVTTLVYPAGPVIGYIPRSVAIWSQARGTEVITPPIESLYPATGISADGTTVFGPEWVWTRAQGYRELREELGFQKQIFGCSDDARTVTGIDGSYPSPGDMFLWQIDAGDPVLLPRAAQVPTGYFYFNAISGDGRIAGGSARSIPEDPTTSTDDYAAVVVTPSQTRLITPVLSQAGVTDLNFDGSVAVGYYALQPSDVRAFRWSEAGGFEQIDGPRGPSDPNYARAVSRDGKVVVGEYLIFGLAGTDAFVWREGTGSVKLRDELIDTFGLEEQLRGWRLLVATDVSADGQVIVGQGINPSGCEQGFVVRFSGPVCFADFNADGGVDGADIESFFLAWADSDPRTDVNQDGGVDGQDIQPFFEQWQNGC